MIETIKKYSTYIIIVIVFGLIVLGILTKKEVEPVISFSDTEYNERSIENVFIYVDVKGAVQNPGVYKLEKDSRMFQVIKLAGGLTADADQNAINLSIILADQDVLYVPTIGEEFPNVTIAIESEIDGIININSATVEALENLPGIGPSTAQKIIDYRTENGLFETTEDIKNVSGIGDATYDEIKDFITT